MFIQLTDSMMFIAIAISVNDVSYCTSVGYTWSSLRESALWRAEQRLLLITAVLL